MVVIIDSMLLNNYNIVIPELSLSTTGYNVKYNLLTGVLPHRGSPPQGFSPAGLPSLSLISPPLSLCIL